MMRHPIDTLPRQINPWAYARGRQYSEGSLPLSETHSLNTWAIADEPVHCTLIGRTDEYGQTCLSGHLSVLLKMQCQRCLEAMETAVKRDFDYVIIRDQALEDRVQGDAEALICADDELNVAWFIEEEVLLAMPMIAKHDDCETPLDLVPDSAPKDAVSDRQHPFLALKEMMKSKEH